MKSIEYLKKLTSIPSPSGFTEEIINYLKITLEEMGYNANKTNKGALILTIKGNDDFNQRFVTAHVDTLGAMVKEIKADGRLSINLIGGFTFNSIENENCIIHTNKRNISGTILPHQNSVHVYDDVAANHRNKNSVEVRLDIKSNSKKETEEAGINIGDFVSFDPRTVITDNGFIKSRHLDDKVSVALLLEILYEIKTQNIKLPYTTTFLFSNHEEVGFGGNSNINPNVKEYLAIDMGALGDGQNSDEYTVSICAKDSSGPYNYQLKNHLVNLAIENNIAYKIDIYPYYGSDASSAIRAGYDFKHALIGAGIESSHAYERTHIDSIKNTYKLIFKYLLSEMVK